VHEMRESDGHRLDATPARLSDARCTEQRQDAFRSIGADSAQKGSEMGRKIAV